MAIFKIDEDLRDSVIEALEQAARTWYDDPNGPWGYECRFCCARSTDGESPPPHDKDCEAMMMIKDLRNLDEVLDWLL